MVFPLCPFFHFDPTQSVKVKSSCCVAFQTQCEDLQAPYRLSRNSFRQHACLTTSVSSIGPEIVQIDEVVATAEIGPDPKGAASNVANEATSSVIAEVAAAAALEAAIRAEATTRTTHAAAMTAAEAPAATTDATIAAATPLIA